MLSKKKVIGLSLALALTFSAVIAVKTLLFAPAQKVRIKTSTEIDEMKAEEQKSAEMPYAAEKAEDTADTGLININTAGRAELESLPGIGPAIADAIISYREERGFFETKEEIMDVSGIGRAKFNAVSGLISVGD